MRVVGSGDGWSGRGDEGPVFRIGGSCSDPVFEDLNLMGRERFLCFGGWHDEFGIGVFDALHELAGGEVTGDDGGLGVWSGIESGFAGIEAKFGFAGGLIAAVAVPAVVGEYGADIAVVVNLGRALALAGLLRGVVGWVGGALPCGGTRINECEEEGDGREVAGHSWRRP